MDSNSTKISYEEARNDAKTLDTCALKMRDEFDEFINHMNQLGSEDVFYGMASEQTKQSFAELRAHFNDFVNLVIRFSTVVKSATDTTEQTEKTIAAAAEELPQ